MRQLSVSEIQRKLHNLDSFDIIEVIDKKRKKVKGYFVDSKYITFIEKLVSDNNRLIVEQLGGSLNRYANPQLRKYEEGAWQRHINEKYKP